MSGHARAQARHRGVLLPVDRRRDRDLLHGQHEQPAAAHAGSRAACPSPATRWRASTRASKRSAEAALKYIVFGGLSAGVMLYGISLLYGVTGTLDLNVQMGTGGTEGLSGRAWRPSSSVEPRSPWPSPIVLVFAGFAYKVSVVPFHFWTPDVYEGAPTPVTTFLAVASKAAGFAVLLALRRRAVPHRRRPGRRRRLRRPRRSAARDPRRGHDDPRQPLRPAPAQPQAHAGLLVDRPRRLRADGCLACDDAREGFSASIFYLAAYYFMNLGAFGFLLYFEGVTGSEEVESR